MDQHPENLSESNQRIADYLHNYCQFDEPGFAVLMQGEWGCGKTWLVKRLQSDGTIPDAIYVSLYGISSKSELDSSLFAACFPSLTNPSAKLGFGLAKILASRVRISWNDSLASTTGASESLGIQQLMTKTNLTGRVVILDDFERCLLKLSETLSICNLLVQEDGCKVIILANEEPLRADGAYAEDNINLLYAKQKEKVIGITLTVQPEVQSALEAFKGALPESLRNCDFLDLAINVHKHSGYRNLRYLRSMFYGFAWLYQSLPSEAKHNRELTRELFKIYAIIQHEVQHASISVDMIDKFLRHFSMGWSTYSAKESSDDSTSLINIAAKYKSLNLNGTIFASNIWSRLFREGSVDPLHLADGLQEYGSLNSVKPAWLALLDFWDMQHDELENQLKSLEDEVNRKQLYKAGEILHAAGLMIFFRDNDLYSPSNEILTMFGDLIDDIRGRNCIVPMSYLRRSNSRPRNSYAGYQFLCFEDDDFQSIKRRVEEAEGEALAAEFKKASLKCTGEFEQGRFYSLLEALNGKSIGIEGRSGAPQEITIEDALMYIDPKLLAQKLLAVTPTEARKVLSAISEFMKRFNIVKDEGQRGWLETFSNALLSAVKADPRRLEKMLLEHSHTDLIVPLLPTS